MRKMDRRSDSRGESDSASLASTSSSFSYTSSSSEDSISENARKHGSSKRKRSISLTRVKEDSGSSSSASSDADLKSRKTRMSRGKLRKSSRGNDKSDREKKKERTRRTRGNNERHGRKEKHRRKEKHDKRRRKSKRPSVDAVLAKDNVPLQLTAKSALQVLNEVQMQQKELVRRNVEIAKARLASGELQRMKHEQMEMQRLYGTVDWREKKKLRAEKSRLERTIAAGQKLASIEERENARMDAFRVADCQQLKHNVKLSGEQKQHGHLLKLKLLLRIACHHLSAQYLQGLVKLLGHDCPISTHVTAITTLSQNLSFPASDSHAGFISGIFIIQYHVGRTTKIVSFYYHTSM